MPQKLPSLYSYGLLGTAKMLICNPTNRGMAALHACRLGYTCGQPPYFHKVAVQTSSWFTHFIPPNIPLFAHSRTLSHPGLTVVVGGDMLPTHHQEVGLRVSLINQPSTPLPSSLPSFFTLYTYITDIETSMSICWLLPDC